MILRLLLCSVLALAACGRPLTVNERAFAAAIMGDQLNAKRIRLVDGAPVGPVTFHRKPRPRVTCRELILPPVKEAIVTAKPAAVTLFNTVFFARDWYTDDYLRGYPDRMSLTAAMLLGHELVHVWQWQNRDRTGYSPLRAAAEHGRSPDPYLFSLDTSPDLLDFGFEQQGSIMEEYVCCRALAPDAARTKRLHEMLSANLPVSDLPKNGKRERDVFLPWKDAELDGICD
ncbi:hypothetical protein [Seohaeicola zhoushanensis]|uniref:DUF4157 domain-containing protein n=1 Tax=Seohaeicola zhoushanensis TaxID=1569283 RepID=A0A8J3M8X5_9RHOB|nr:hypothetical protein [Seohaeicola zhoushanensis]GHF55824.1 hypothetical protein GCM10017056_29180 [Seohaeicola zhoushanensis]